MQSNTVPVKTKVSILAAGLLSFIGILVETSMTVTFPTLMRTMHVSLATVQWLTTAYLLLVTIVMSSTAFVLKRFTFRRLFFFADLMSLAGTITAMVAPNFALLLAGRMLQAVATGIATPLMFQLVFTRIPFKQIGLWTGLASVIVSLAPALGPTYGGILTSLWSWRAIFIGILPVLVAATLLGAYGLHGAALGTQGQQFDFGGLALLGITFTSLVWTLNLAGTHGWISANFGMSMFVAMLLVASMTWYARRGQRHLFDYSILKNGVLRQRLLQYFGLQLINIGLSFVLPLFAQDVLHASPMSAGLMLLPGALVGAIVAPLAGKIYDRRGATMPLLTSASLAALAMLLFATLTHHFTIGVIAALYMVLRVGFNSGFGTAVSDASLQVAGPQKADQNSMFSMMQQFAGSLGTSLMSAVIAAKTLHSSTIAATVNGSQIDFWLLFGVAVAILGTGLWVAKKKKTGL
ncbi:MFS transporter [Lacticaseibacillus camelliae]|nr:MFS transporter [Lacticaseibacillus camelliae]